MKNYIVALAILGWSFSSFAAPAPQTNLLLRFDIKAPETLMEYHRDHLGNLVGSRLQRYGYYVIIMPSYHPNKTIQAELKVSVHVTAIPETDGVNVRWNVEFLNGKNENSTRSGESIVKLQPISTAAGERYRHSMSFQNSAAIFAALSRGISDDLQGSITP